MSTKAVTLLLLTIMAATLAFLATLPLQLPGFMADGASAPMDEGEVRAASAGLTAAAAALWFACMLMFHLEQPGRLIGRFYAAATVAFAAYRAWEVAVFIVAWLVQVNGPLAVYYRLAVAAPASLLLFFGALRAFL